LEYDPLTNAWTQKADFGGSPRILAIGFSIGSKGYIGTGADGLGSSDFWEYDPLADTWTQKADFPYQKYGAVGFSIGNNGYIAMGIDDDLACYNDFWQYDPVTDIWTQKANFPNEPREGAVGFSIGTEGYIGLGAGNLCDASEFMSYSDFWEYNSIADIWTHSTNMVPYYDWWAYGVGFSISGKGYAGTGSRHPGGMYLKDFWEFTPDTINNTCSAYYTIYPDTVPHNYFGINNSAGTQPITYSWSWGDGNFSSGAAPSHTYSTPGYYNICLTITDGTGCTNTYCDSSYYLYRGTSNTTMVTVTVISTTTGTNNLNEKNNSFNIFPNPSSGTFQLTINTKHNVPMECEIINVMGEKVYQAPLPAHSANWPKCPLDICPPRGEEGYAVLDVSFLAKGIYLVRVSDGKNFESKKLVIE
jgi:PKD domain-containing protein